MKWATFIGTLIGAAVVAAGAVRAPGAAPVPVPVPVPARAGEAPAEITQQQWAEMTARLRLLDERTARIESILMENRR